MFKTDVVPEIEKKEEDVSEEMDVEGQKASGSKEGENVKGRKPTCIIVLGMAGSGKTTFVKKITSTLYNTGKPYVINLDPACTEVPYPANIGKLVKESLFPN